MQTALESMVATILQRATQIFRLGLVEMAADGFGGFSWDYGGQGFGGGFVDGAETAELGE